MREIRTSGSTRGEERQPLPLLLYRHPGFENRDRCLPLYNPTLMAYGEPE